MHGIIVPVYNNYKKLYSALCVLATVKNPSKTSLISLYKHDMSRPICRHSLYRDPCGYKAVRHNYVCSEYTIYTLFVSLISVAKGLLHSL